MNKGIFASLLMTLSLLVQGCVNQKDKESVLKINNSEEFISFVNDYNSGKFDSNDSLVALSVELGSDISIVNQYLVPIGTEERPFIGTFNGNGHTITCCGIGQSETADNVGLFGYAKNSTIKSVTIVTQKVVGQRSVGVVCGSAYRTNISDCKTSGQIKGLECVGGIVGCACYGGIADCYFVGQVSAHESLSGGIVGYLEFGGVVRSYAGGQVSGRSAVNPISGNMTEDVMVSECADRVNIVIEGKDNRQNGGVAATNSPDKLTRLLFQM